MDFGFNEEQEMLRRSSRSLLERECSSAHVRQMMEDERGYARELWRKMAGLGWLGLILPEEHGGAGLNPIARKACERVCKPAEASPSTKIA